MEKGAKMHMKEWLIAQIESGRYEGLFWENEDKTMFRIPWKHAAKKDYKQTADAALFKVTFSPFQKSLLCSAFIAHKVEEFWPFLWCLDF